MLLCNLNQTVITGSADRTIRAWSPHMANSSPALIGMFLVGRLAARPFPTLFGLDRPDPNRLKLMSLQVVTETTSVP